MARADAAVTAHAAPFSFEIEPDGDATAVRLVGRFDVDRIAKDWRAIVRRIEHVEGRVHFDVAGLDEIDGGGAAVLVEFATRLAAGGRGGTIDGARGSVDGLIELYRSRSTPPPPPQAEVEESFLAQVGRHSLSGAAQFAGGVVFLGAFARECGATLVRPRRFLRRDFVTALSRTGPDGIAIVALVNFLIGTTLGFQSAVQLERYGADVFTASLVGLSVVRELGPLMTGILIAGRSGAAFAAELGTMKVSEEIDALRTLGLSPQRFCVVPRVAALIVSAPLLTILADAMGILGGLAIGCGTRGVSLTAYWNQTVATLDTNDVLTGLGKSVAFGALIGLIACHRGLETRGGADGVGRSTTTAVVSILFALILADSLFTYLYTLYGL